jgi:hypothetical protein
MAGGKAVYRSVATITEAPLALYVAILPECWGCPPELGKYPTAEQNYRFATL